ncbi:ribonuclease E inhibitor RraB [Ornithinimicrobium ciconiae]|uniref:ribonuclease E inhibitor RraB n=1 Tax=Ornithinimicrobium ciconiae TaxID=2594265 RepID=UPI001D18A878|nr:ribonuclease E inhibitor RraB [Ornithinimicrobium ciconiae]
MDSASEPDDTAGPGRPGAEHLLIFPERETARQVADELQDEGFAQVSVLREASRTEDDDEAHEWAVHVVDQRLPDASGVGPTRGSASVSRPWPWTTTAGMTTRQTRDHPSRPRTRADLPVAGLNLT